VVTGQVVQPAKVERSRAFRGAPTSAERALWRALRKGRLGGLKFRRQQVVDGFIVDFYCHALLLIVEVDGPVHDENPEADLRRDAILSARGLSILRFPNAAVVERLPTVLESILFAAGEQQK
jgi:very-short-patch-repair endonuclease